MTMTTTTAAPAATIDYFESVYEAAGDPARVPVAMRGPSAALINWLNAAAPSLIRCGARVAVVGCGLGDSAREIQRRGYEVTAFDCSQTAIRWARQLDPDHAEGYVRADLLDPPARWIHRFDLVVNTNNLQFLPPQRRAEAVAAMARLLAPHGHLLVVCAGTDRPSEPAVGPPWPMTTDDLRGAAARGGLVAEGAIYLFTDDDNPPAQRIRAVFARSR